MNSIGKGVCAVILGTVSAMSAADNSRTSLDWPGVYRGTLPCADCPGIAVRLLLMEDGQYQRRQTWLGKEEDATRFDQGVFTWNAAGSHIELQPAADSGVAQAYQVGETQLFHLDQAGDRIEGDLAARYVLKQNPKDAQLEGLEWQLFELQGQDVPTSTRSPSLAFDPRRSVVAGSDGCNRFTGPYDLSAGGRISIGPLATTMMACPDMQMPDHYRKVLLDAGDYQVVDGALSLFKGRSAISARFMPGIAAQ